MSATSKIEWTDATWNPVRAKLHGKAVAPAGPPPGKLGWHCEHVSEGCRHCYAETMNRRLGTGLDFKPGLLAPRGPVEVFLDETMLLAPLRWKKSRMIFAGSMTDLFGPWVTDAMLDRIFAVMALAGQHTFQLLTKRPERAREYFATPVWIDGLGRNRGREAEISRAISELLDGTGRHLLDSPLGGCEPGLPLPNVWLGTSVEDQTRADERIPHLLATPAAVRFLSCEPLLESVDLTDIRSEGTVLDPECWGDCRCDSLYGVDPGCRRHLGDGQLTRKIDWVIVGGESGPGARPMHPDWARSLRDQCAAAGVPFFFKQWGNHAPLLACRSVDSLLQSNDLTAWPDGSFGVGLPSARGGPGQQMYRATKRAAGRLLDGVEHSAMPVRS